MPRRKIASNLLWTAQGVVRNPLVELADGQIVSVGRCDEPDREATTEFYAGLLVADFPEDYRAAFATLNASQPLSEQLPSLPRGTALVVISGLDYTTLRLTARSQIRLLAEI